MAKSNCYWVKTKALKGHEVPPLLNDFAAWVGKQEHGAIGWFDGMMFEAIPKEWDEEHAAQLQKNAFSFLTLGEGSMLALINTGEKKAPPAVVLLGSEGDRNTVANSLEEFLTLWSKGETEVDDLDDGDGEDGRRALGAWLKQKKIKSPKAKDFDFQAWLDTGGVAAGSAGASSKKQAAAPAAKAPAAIKRAPTDMAKKLGPKLRQLAAIMGMRVDAPEVVTYVTKTLGKKLPAFTSERSDDAHVVAPKFGLELLVSHDILNEAYPPINKTAKSFIPYVSYAWVYDKIGEPVLGVPWNVQSEEAIVKILGKPTDKRPNFGEKKPTIPYWGIDLDIGAGIEIEIELRKKGLDVNMRVKSALGLEKFVDVSTGIFVGWAATNGLLDESRFTGDGAADVLAQVKKRKAKGSDLIKAAMPRGLWDDHLKNDKELRSLAYGYFHNLDKLWITADLKKVFGKREGKYGHDEPKVDDDTWEAVDKASKIFRDRFGKWASKKK